MSRPACLDVGAQNNESVRYFRGTLNKHDMSETVVWRLYLIALVVAVLLFYRNATDALRLSALHGALADAAVDGARLPVGAWAGRWAEEGAVECLAGHCPAELHDARLRERATKGGGSVVVDMATPTCGIRPMAVYANARGRLVGAWT